MAGSTMAMNRRKGKVVREVCMYQGRCSSGWAGLGVSLADAVAERFPYIEGHYSIAAIA